MCILTNVSMDFKIYVLYAGVDSRGQGGERGAVKVGGNAY